MEKKKTKVVPAQTKPIPAQQPKWQRQNWRESSIKRSAYPLTKANAILMAASGVLIVLGFLLMLGGANDGAEFNYDIFSVRRTVVGPTIAFLGFVAMAVAIIFKRPSAKGGKGGQAGV